MCRVICCVQVMTGAGRLTLQLMLLSVVRLLSALGLASRRPAHLSLPRSNTVTTRTFQLAHLRHSIHSTINHPSAESPLNLTSLVHLLTLTANSSIYHLPLVPQPQLKPLVQPRLKRLVVRRISVLPPSVAHSVVGPSSQTVHPPLPPR